jgi:hypothetical protein
MVNFNKKDDNMEQIANATGMLNLSTKNEYRIYGLANELNPPILFSAQENIVNAEQEKTIAGFLATNGIDCATEDVEANNNKIYIGLRRDVRNNILLASNLIQTFVYFLEGRVELPIDFKVDGIPSFKTNIS